MLRSILFLLCVCLPLCYSAALVYNSTIVLEFPLFGTTFKRVLTLSGTAPIKSLVWSPLNFCDDTQLFAQDPIPGTATFYLVPKLNPTFVVYTSGENVIASAKTDLEDSVTGVWSIKGNTYYEKQGRYLYFSTPASASFTTVTAFGSTVAPTVGTVTNTPPVPCTANCYSYGDPHLICFDGSRRDNMLTLSVLLAKCGDLTVNSLQMPCGSVTTSGITTSVACNYGVNVVHGTTTIAISGTTWSDGLPLVAVNAPTGSLLAKGACSGSLAPYVCRRAVNLYQVTTPDGLVSFTANCSAGAIITVNCTGSTVQATGTCGQTTKKRSISEEYVTIDTHAADTPVNNVDDTPVNNMDDTPVNNVDDTPVNNALTTQLTTRPRLRAVDISQACQFVSAGSFMASFCGITPDDIYTNCQMDVGLVNDIQAALAPMDVFIRTCAALFGVPIASALQSTFSVPSSTLQLLSPLTVTIQAVTAFGDNITTSFLQNQFTVSAAGQDIPAIDQFNGKYLGIITGGLPLGRNLVRVKLYGIFDIAGSPFNVTVVEPPAIAALCNAIGAGLQALTNLLFNILRLVKIQTFYASGVPRTTGGEAARLSVTFSGGNVNWNGVITDNGDGSYQLSYSATCFLSVITITIKLGGVNIAGSPYTVLCLL